MQKWMVAAKKADFKAIGEKFQIDQVVARIIRNRDVVGEENIRGVHVGKGAKVKNCVLMQDTIIEEGARVEYVITDKNVTVTEGKSLTGNDSYQVYVAKGQVV